MRRIAIASAGVLRSVAFPFATVAGLAFGAGVQYLGTLTVSFASRDVGVDGERDVAQLGAEYRLSSADEVIARNCIFRQACEVADSVVCELHAGILEGAFQAAGLDARTEAFRNHAQKGCAYRLLTSSKAG